MVSTKRWEASMVCKWTSLYKYKLTSDLFSGLCAAQIHVIFLLPSHYGSFPHPLAYIEWFWPFSTIDETVGMHKIIQSTRNQAWHSAIVSMSNIFQACHLAPKYGPVPVDRSWTHLNVLEKSNEFYLNHYNNFHLFEILQAWLLLLEITLLGTCTGGAPGHHFLLNPSQSYVGWFLLTRRVQRHHHWFAYTVRWHWFLLILTHFSFSDTDYTLFSAVAFVLMSFVPHSQARPKKKTSALAPRFQEAYQCFARGNMTNSALNVCPLVTTFSTSLLSTKISGSPRAQLSQVKARAHLLSLGFWLSPLPLPCPSLSLWCCPCRCCHHHHSFVSIAWFCQSGYCSAAIWDNLGNGYTYIPSSSSSLVSEQTLHQGNGTCFFEFFRDLKKCEKTDKSKKGLKVTKLTATFLCWVDCLKKALFVSFWSTITLCKFQCTLGCPSSFY